MPEYMTKCEPVDKKPYIVYTDEKGILYSGDPDSDIPGGGTEYSIACYHFDGEGLTPIDSIIYPAVWNPDTNWWKTSGDAVTKAKPGDVLQYAGVTYGQIMGVASSLEDGAYNYPYAGSEGQQAIVMPAHDICVVLGTEG